MTTFWIVARDAGIVCVTGAIITGILLFIKWLSKLSKILTQMNTNGEERKQEMKAVIYILKRLIVSNKATLETLRDGTCNGNVTVALAKLDEADMKYEGLFLDKINNVEA